MKMLAVLLLFCCSLTHNALAQPLPDCVSSSSDSDGDGYGWENHSSCKVAVSGGSCEDRGDYPWGWNPTTLQSCRLDVAACVDTPPLHDGWGWNGVASCQIPVAVDDSRCDEVGAFPWGWNPTTKKSCRLDLALERSDTQQQGESAANEAQPAQPKDYSEADITDLILITGQSNARGTQAGFDASLDVPHPRAFAFTREGWRPADLHQVWDLNWFPGKQPGLEPSNNFAFHMARNTAMNDSTRVVGIILVTDPGKPIENWSLNGTFWQVIESRVHTAINQLPHKSQLDGILWHQGESNAGESDYHEKLDQMINNFRIQNWFSADKPFICGETAIFQRLNQQLMALNADGDHWTGCVSSEGLTTEDDGIHFDAAGMRELGRRYAVKYLEMTR